MLAVPDLNPLQKKILQLFNINPDDMIKQYLNAKKLILIFLKHALYRTKTR
jgi:hypothetical protein